MLLMLSQQICSVGHAVVRAFSHVKLAVLRTLSRVKLAVSVGLGDEGFNAIEAGIISLEVVINLCKSSVDVCLEAVVADPHGGPLNHSAGERNQEDHFKGAHVNEVLG